MGGLSDKVGGFSDVCLRPPLLLLPVGGAGAMGPWTKPPAFDRRCTRAFALTVMGHENNQLDALPTPFDPWGGVPTRPRHLRRKTKC